MIDNSDNLLSDDEIEYRQYLENILSHFNEFMLLSQKSTTTIRNRLPLKSRKKSIELRKIFKDFREVSLKHEKYLKSKSNT